MCLLRFDVRELGWKWGREISKWLYSKTLSFCASSLGVVYYTVLGQGSEFGAIKRAYIPDFESGSNNPIREVDLGLKYLMQPDGLAVDWVGR